MARVFVTRHLPGGALKRLAAEHDVDLWREQLPPSPDDLRAHAADKAGLLALLSDRVDAELMDACPDLRVVSNYAVGSDNIDLEAAAQRTIAVGVTADVLTDATADLAFACLLAAMRRLPEAVAAVRAGQWTTWGPEWMLGHEVHGGLQLKPLRGDLVFWKGHVGILSAPDRMVHASGHHMTVVNEPLDYALARIGPPTSVRRIG